MISDLLNTVEAERELDSIQQLRINNLVEEIEIHHQVEETLESSLVLVSEDLEKTTGQKKWWRRLSVALSITTIVNLIKG